MGRKIAARIYNNHQQQNIAISKINPGRIRDIN